MPSSVLRLRVTDFFPPEQSLNVPWVLIEEVVGRLHTAIANRIDARFRLDLQHFRTEVGEQSGAQRACDRPGEIEHADAIEGTARGGGTSSVVERRVGAR